MFSVVSKIKEKVTKEIAKHEVKKNNLAEEINNDNETEVFLKQLKKLSKLVCPFKNPAREFDNFGQYKHTNEIAFTTKENKYSLSDIIKITGLKSVRYCRGWNSDKWEASYIEYYNLFETGNISKANSAKSAILAIHTNISNNKQDYSNFIFRYLESVTNICSIIDEYGTSFVYENQELFDSVFGIIGSIVAEYQNYSNAIKEYKKCQALEKLQMEKDYINNTIKQDNLMLEFNQK